MPIPKDILAVERPSGTIVQKSGNKYYVIKRTSRYDKGRRNTPGEGSAEDIPRKRRRQGPRHAVRQTFSAVFDHGSLPARSEGVVISGGTGMPSIWSAVGAIAESFASGVSLTPAASFAT